MNRKDASALHNKAAVEILAMASAVPDFNAEHVLTATKRLCKPFDWNLKWLPVEIGTVDRQQKLAIQIEIRFVVVVGIRNDARNVAT